jgi:hypothetical protein
MTRQRPLFTTLYLHQLNETKTAEPSFLSLFDSRFYYFRAVAIIVSPQLSLAQESTSPLSDDGSKWISPTS